MRHNEVYAIKSECCLKNKKLDRNASNALNTFVMKNF